jgi:hypothetical protein
VLKHFEKSARELTFFKQMLTRARNAGFPKHSFFNRNTQCFSKIWVKSPLPAGVAV